MLRIQLIEVRHSGTASNLSETFPGTKLWAG